MTEETYEQKIAAFRKILAESENVVFFGGAGVSTESGIPDFRSQDGLYRQEYDYPPEEIISHSFFLGRPSEFYRFYRKKMLFPDAKPNACHLALARLEARGKLKGVVTQNIDGLHRKAGSKNVCELHGSVWRNFCMNCGKAYSLFALTERIDGARDGIPRCGCGGVIKPDVVLYEEALDDDVVTGAVRLIRRADTLIVGGTSLIVYPAAGLLQYFCGRHLVVVNTTPTQADAGAELVVAEKIGKVFSDL